MLFPAIFSSILVAVLVTLPNLVTLWSRNAVRNCICSKRWGDAFPALSPPPPTPGPRALWNEFSNLVWHVLKPETHKRNHRNETTVTTKAKWRRNERNHQNNRSKRMMHHILVLEMFCHSLACYCVSVVSLFWFGRFGGYSRFVSMVSFWRFGF